MIRRTIFGPAFAVLLVLFLYGLWSEHLFDQRIWAPEGLVRWAWFSGIYASAALVVILLRPRWFVPGLLVAALVCTAVVAGVQAPIAVLYLFASAWALGTLLSLDGTLALLAGLGVYSFLIGLIVLLPVNYPAVYAVALAIPLVWRPRRLLASASLSIGRLLPAENAGRKGLWAAALCGFILWMHLLVVLGPEISSDGLSMHLAIPASVHTHHQWIFNPQEKSWAVMPKAADWGFTAAYMLGGEAAARLFNFGLLLALAVMVYSLARSLLPSGLSLLVTALFASSPMVQLVTGSLFVENFWAAMLVGAVLALVRYTEGGDRRYALATAMLLGTALAAKLIAAAYLAPVCILLALELSRRSTWRLLPATAVVLLVFGAPPYLDALVRTGNPVFPFFNHVFKSPYFDTEAPFTDARFQSPDAVTALFDLTFRTSRHFEGQNGGWAFFCFLFVPMAALLVRPRRDHPGWIALAVLLPAAILTLALRGNVRYLYPALPLCAAAAAAVLAHGQTQVGAGRALLAASAAMICLNLCFLPASGGYHKQFFVLATAERDRYLTESAPGRRIVAWLNESHNGEPVAFASMDQVAGLAGRSFITGWHNNPFLREVEAAVSAEHCIELMQRFGMRLIVAPANLSYVPQVSLRRMIAEFTRIEFTHAGWQVRTLAGVPPRPSSPTPLPSPGTHDDLDTRIEFWGRWTSGRFAEAANGSVTYSNAAGNWFRVAFAGSEITWVYTKAFNRGLAEVRIDGVRKEVVDLYSRKTVWQARSSFGDLGAGPHVMEVRVLGQKHPSAADCFVDADLLVVK